MSSRAIETRDPLSSSRAIYRIWPDFEVRTLIVKSVSTVKADAPRSAFAAIGTDVVWAVIDSGIDGSHRHFVRHRNLELPLPLQHFDFTSSAAGALSDEAGHGTHVAGIIAGEIAEPAHGPLHPGGETNAGYGGRAPVSTALSSSLLTPRPRDKVSPPEREPVQAILGVLAWPWRTKEVLPLTVRIPTR